jgi:UDP-N-acetylmuramoyl-tripeptide--D-alanyl-D-alanine ligase
MEPKPLNGAWIIDDTYNGNIEGMRAGLELLKELPAKKRIYVTPGLVEQGEKTENVHTELGRLIAAAADSLQANGYQGTVQIESDPLNFYENLQYGLAAGDVVLMQNDWTDNYA